MNTQNSRFPNWEEYEFSTSNKQPLAPLSFTDCWDIVDGMTQKDIEKLGFSNEEEIWDFINQAYTITE